MIGTGDISPSHCSDACCFLSQDYGQSGESRPACFDRVQEAGCVDETRVHLWMMQASLAWVCARLGNHVETGTVRLSKRRGTAENPITSSGHLGQSSNILVVYRPGLANAALTINLVYPVHTVVRKAVLQEV